MVARFCNVGIWWLDYGWILDELWLDSNYIEIVAILCLPFDKFGAGLSLYCG